MKIVVPLLAILFVNALLLLIGGCHAEEPHGTGDGAGPNAALSAPYTPGTGISGNSFGRHPRFYEGGATDDQASPATQPAGR